jgi:hypothetical protein
MTTAGERRAGAPASQAGQDELPPGAFDVALRLQHELQERRVRAMYNRHRAVFAEFLVAALLSESEVVEDPSAAWDIVWRHPGSGGRIRIQVKCSGEFLPRRPDQPAVARWDVRPPSFGYDVEHSSPLGAGHHCELFVLARHTGTSIETGWAFAAIAVSQLLGRRMVNLRTLDSIGAELVPGEALEAAANRALTQAAVEPPPVA